jgi:hypothetical protein
MAKIIVIVINEDYFDDLFLFFFYMFLFCIDRVDNIMANYSKLINNANYRRFFG